MEHLGPKESWGAMELRQHAWEYFRYHASQRTTVFNFYLIVCALLTTAYFRVVVSPENRNLGVLLGLIFPLLSFIFWKLDQRNAGMVEIAEAALRALEETCAPHEERTLSNIVHVFSREADLTARAKQERSFWPWKNLYEHGYCFGVIFVVSASLGVIAALYAAPPTLR